MPIELLRGKQAQPKPIPTFGVLVCPMPEMVLLVAHRGPSKQQAAMFGLPAGVGKKGETAKQTAARETFEEAGIPLDPQTLQSFPRNRATATLLTKQGRTVFSVEIFLGTRLPHIPVIRSSPKTSPWLMPITDIANLQEAGLLLPNQQRLIYSGYEYLKRQ
jgi:8-oxo-dGTP pyrophosphatase MutT (NUDIX family)